METEKINWNDLNKIYVVLVIFLAVFEMVSICQSPNFVLNETKQKSLNISGKKFFLEIDTTLGCGGLENLASSSSSI